MTDFLFDGPAEAEITNLLAHGAGAPMDSAAMSAAAKALAIGALYPLHGSWGCKPCALVGTGVCCRVECLLRRSGRWRKPNEGLSDLPDSRLFTRVPAHR